MMNTVDKNAQTPARPGKGLYPENLTNSTVTYFTILSRKGQLPLATSRQIAFLRQLMGQVGTARVTTVKAGLGLAGISALDMSRNDAARLIAELCRIRGR